MTRTCGLVMLPRSEDADWASPLDESVAWGLEAGSGTAPVVAGAVGGAAPWELVSVAVLGPTLPPPCLSGASCFAGSGAVAAWSGALPAAGCCGLAALSLYANTSWQKSGSPADWKKDRQ